MIRVGLTGNIGSGKSIVAKVFETLNIPVFYSDIEAKKLYKNPVVKSAIIALLGKEILDHHGEIELKKLAQHLFSDKNKLKQIEAIIHPKVRTAHQNWLTHHKDSPYTIIESAILLKSELQEKVDKVIVVTAPKDIRIERVINRDNVSKEQVIQRINNQLKEEEMIRQADFIIYNDNQHLVLPQIMAIHKTFNVI